MTKLLDQLVKRTRTFRKGELREKSTIGDPLPAPATTLEVPNAPAHGLTIAFIPDTQVKPDVPTDHIRAAGRYIARKRPDVIVFIGDWWDMQSLEMHSSIGSASRENQRYRADIDAGRKAMDDFHEPIAKEAGYNPLEVFTEGNHEYRVDRSLDADPEMIGTYSKEDFHLADYGIKVYPFLQPVVIGGVAFSHFFPSGVMGRPITTAQALVRKLHMSAIAGHQQGRMVAYDKRADGGDITAIISGSFYQHNEKYLSPFTNKHWRGMWFLHEVKDGSFDEMALSIDYLKRKFGDH